MGGVGNLPSLPPLLRHAAMSPVIPASVSRRGAGFPDTPWGSKSISGGHGAPRRPTRNTRSRRCASPAYCASSTVHATPYPSSSSAVRTIPKSRPRWEENSPGTFSRRSQPGRSPRATRMTSQKSPLRSPASPFRWPATLTSWHGNPAVMRSTRIPLAIHGAARRCASVIGPASANQKAPVLSGAAPRREIGAVLQA